MTLEKFETELRDTSEFYRWQSEEWKKEEEAKLARVERLRLDMVESRGRAAEATRRNLARNKLAAAEMRARGEEVLRIREKEAQHEVAQKQRLAEAVREVRDSRPAVSKRRVRSATPGSVKPCVQTWSAWRARRRRTRLSRSAWI